MINFPRLREMIRQESKLKWAKEKEMSNATKRTSTFAQDGGSGRGYRRGSRVEDSGIILAAIDSELELLQGRLKQQREELQAETEKLEDSTVRTALGLRYQSGIGPSQIAEVLNYSESHVFTLLKKGERAIAEAQKT